jgi:hypothetical protein
MGKLKATLQERLQQALDGGYPLRSVSRPHETPKPTKRITLRNSTTQNTPDTMYGLFADDRLIDLYEDRASADYDAYICRMGEEVLLDSGEPAHTYKVEPIRVNKSRLFSKG